jgi:hypothetical protein
MIVDTIPPAIRAVSRLHYVNRGGSGLVVYQTTSDSIKSGLFIKDYFFPGFPAAEKSQEGMHVCYFGIPLDIKRIPEIYLWAEDKAGNRSKAKFYCRIRKKRFRTDKINVTDRFLKQILPYFSFYLKDTSTKDIVKFLKINQDLRRENAETFYNLRTKTSPTRLWDGVWLRLKNAANMAGRQGQPAVAGLDFIGQYVQRVVMAANDDDGAAYRRQGAQQFGGHLGVVF